MDADTSRIIDARHLYSSEARSQSSSRAARRGQLIRLRRGIYRSPLPSISELAREERAAESRRRYLERIEAVVLTRKSEVVVSHESAAALLGLPHLGEWPREVHLVEPRDSDRRSKNGVVIHRSDLGADAIVRIGGLWTTDLVRTVLDIAAERSFVRGVVAADHALRESDAVTLDSLASMAAPPGMRFAARTRAVLDFADAAAASPGESVSRVLLRVLGCPRPSLQLRHAAPAWSTARYFETDFEWPGLQKIAEFDGAGKYLKPEYLDGREPGEIVFDEKRREDALRKEGNSIARWGWYELRRPWLVREALLSIAVPMRRPVGPLAPLW